MLDSYIKTNLASATFCETYCNDYPECLGYSFQALYAYGECYLWVAVGRRFSSDPPQGFSIAPVKNYGYGKVIEAAAIDANFEEASCMKKMTVENPGKYSKVTHKSVMSSPFQESN